MKSITLYRGALYALTQWLIICICYSTFAQTDDNGPGIGTKYPRQGNLGPSFYNSGKTFYGRQWATPFGTVSAPTPFGYGQNYYTVATPTANYKFWRSPSGYYYPWYHYPVGFVPPYGWAVPIYINQGNAQPQRPSLTQVIDDMGNFLKQSNTEGKFQANDYQQLNKRFNDLKSKVNYLKFQEGGTLSESTEEDLRTDLENFSKEASFRLKN